MIELNTKKCTACGACVQKCPKKCIELSTDDNGFLYPKINTDVCIDCNLCVKVCPIDDISLSVENKPASFACVNTKKTTLNQSTSGGIFAEIANYVLNKGGVVYGCSYEDHLQATHIRIDSHEKLHKLFGSKYVQSKTCNTFSECEKDLISGKLVLYSGTPCQIAGLKKYLQKDYVNLLTIDLVCHGVSSQSYFDAFIKYLESNENAICTNYSFRSKKNSGWSIAGIAEFKNTNGKIFSKKQFYFSNYYYFYYVNCSTYRDSCYSCQYADSKRVGDFTLGDFWGVEAIDLPFDIKNGCSLVLVNSKKAFDVFKELDINYHQVPLDFAIRNNCQLSAPSKPKYDRSELLREYREQTPELTQKNFKKKHKKQIFLGKLKYLVPIEIKHILLKLKYKFI